MSKIQITGGNKLYGEIEVQSAKNSVLPLIACTVLYGEEVRINNCKPISDIITMCQIFEDLGGEYQFLGKTLILKPQNVSKYKPSERLSTAVRSSFFLAGALISRFGQAEMIFPGGCKIGKRPIDVHIDGLKALGLRVEIQEKHVKFYGGRVVGKRIRLSFPSVGATENLLMASVFCEGETVIQNVAKEPEICDLQDLLNLFGCKVKGAGTDTIVVTGVKGLKKEKIEFTPIGDRIEAGTYMLATACCGGEITIKNIFNKNIYYIYKKILQNHCKITVDNDKINIKYNNRGKGLGCIKTMPYPLFPTDLQAPLCVYAGVLSGESQITETLFENRFGHIIELQKMGLDAFVKGNTVFIKGRDFLTGASVYASDLRAGAALVIAGLCAQGKTEVYNTHFIDRGYYQIEKAFSQLGGKITREE